MNEVLPNQDFYPFESLERLNPLDQVPVKIDNFYLEAAKVTHPFLGINLDLILYASSGLLKLESETQNPLGPVKYDFEYKNGLFLVRKFPLGLYVVFRSDSIDKMRQAQWYQSQVGIGRSTHLLDTLDDMDLLFNDPSSHFEGKEIEVMGHLSQSVVLPYDLSKLRKIKCSMIEYTLPQ